MRGGLNGADLNASLRLHCLLLIIFLMALCTSIFSFLYQSLFLAIFSVVILRVPYCFFFLFCHHFRRAVCFHFSSHFHDEFNKAHAMLHISHFNDKYNLIKSSDGIKYF